MKEKKEVQPRVQTRSSKVVRKSGVSGINASRDLDIEKNVRRKWKRKKAVNPRSLLLDHGQITPEQQENERLLHEMTNLKVERETLKKSEANFPTNLS